MHILLEFFGFGEIGFWILMGLASIFFTVGVENNKSILSFCILLGLFICYTHTIYDFIKLHYDVVISISLAYIILGVLWSMFRWYKHVHWEVQSGIKTYGSKMEKSDILSRINDKIDPKENKARITSWIVWWPWSAFWNVSGDFLTFIFDNMVGVYQNIVNRIISNAFSNLK